MKHLKTFENRGYKVGEFVKLKLIPNYVTDYKIYNKDDDLFAEITGFSTDTAFITRDSDVAFELYDGKIVYGNLLLVRRGIDEEEIKIYNTKKEMYKYNI